MVGQCVRLDWQRWLKYGLVSGGGAYLLSIASPFILLLGESNLLLSMGALGTVVAIAIVTVAGLIFALIVAAVQRLLVRRHAPEPRWWLVASVAGAGAGLAIALGWRELADDPVPALMVTNYLMPLLAGAGQWLVLRSRVSQAGWWMLACAAALVPCLGLLSLVIAAVAVLVIHLGASGRRRRAVSQSQPLEREASPQSVTASADAGDDDLAACEADALVVMLRTSDDPARQQRVLSELEKRGLIENV
jgi:hypothetical protein